MKTLTFKISWLALKAALTLFAALPSVKRDESSELLTAEAT